ncbi:putative lipase esterase family protein [Phaeoacremonium minimum UCRPA7]|uniref:Putative lipase esterase family protein n=1 Tax=Phaeoacremonium minimum (strain UCR-PA7) TaxID=1286976 RepID=R8BRD3_PHAM7|nr:putative lipase esterase family protein [Phaeoacremonium minimum UCRPA7]EOO01884.1 putative lipase esterase family protein [Phaeoacremonium minimum UCRPA7]
MKASVVAVLSFVSFAFGNVLVERACAGNNCNRAVTGTRDGLEPLSVRSADCSSFLLTTVTPAATTVTVTVDEEPTTAVVKRDFALEIRQATEVPTAIPTYAAVCSSAEKYASACSCFGVTGSVTTAPTPTVTVTTTIDYCEDL